jgi:hypothetical protein
VPPKLQINHNSSVLLILQTISFVFTIMQKPRNGKWFVLSIMHKIDRGGGTPFRSQFTLPPRLISVLPTRDGAKI